MLMLSDDKLKLLREMLLSTHDELVNDDVDAVTTQYLYNRTSQHALTHRLLIEILAELRMQRHTFINGKVD